MHPKFPLFLLGLMWLGATCASAQIDDFDDGELSEWTILDVLADAGAPAGTVSFPDKGVRLQSLTSPDPEALGPSRLALVWGGAESTDVTAIMDVVAWDSALFQDMGILVRGTDIGLGTTGGYAWSYDVDEGKAYLSRLDSEAAATLASEELPLELDKDYRFQITAIGKDITGTLSEASAPDVPLLILSAEDDLFTEGETGIFTNAGVPDGTTDATFDNFAVFDPVAPSDLLTLTEMRLLENEVQVDFSVSPSAGERYLLEASSNLTEWSPLANVLVPLGQVQGSLATSRDGAAVRFFRVGVEPPYYVEDFEGEVDGWTTIVDAGNTEWELGMPAAADLNTAHSGNRVYGTDLDAPFGISNSATLRSPVIDISGLARPELSFWYYVDVNEGTEGVQLSYLDAAGETLFIFDEIFWTKTEDWTQFTQVIPENVRNQAIILSWRFLSDPEEPNSAGFFLDDVILD